MPAGMAVLWQRDGRWLCEECVTVNDPLESWCFVCGLLKTGAEDDGNSSIVSPIRMLVRQLNYATQALGDPATAEQKKTTLKRLVDALATFSRSAEEEMQTSDDDKVVNPSNLTGLAEAVRGRKGGIIDEKLAGATDEAFAKMAGALDACGNEVNWQGTIGEKGRLAVGFAIDVAHVAKMKEETCFQNLRYTKLITALDRARDLKDKKGVANLEICLALYLSSQIDHHTRAFRIRNTSVQQAFLEYWLDQVVKQGLLVPVVPEEKAEEGPSRKRRRCSQLKRRSPSMEQKKKQGARTSSSSGGRDPLGPIHELPTDTPLTVTEMDELFEGCGAVI